MQPNSSVKANTHMEGDVVLLNIDSKHFAASSSQPKDTQMISIKLENLDSDSEQIFDNLSSKNLTIPVNTIKYTFIFLNIFLIMAPLPLNARHHENELLNLLARPRLNNLNRAVPIIHKGFHSHRHQAL